MDRASPFIPGTNDYARCRHRNERNFTSRFRMLERFRAKWIPVRAKRTSKQQSGAPLRFHRNGNAPEVAAMDRQTVTATDATRRLPVDAVAGGDAAGLGLVALVITGTRLLHR